MLNRHSSLPEISPVALSCNQQCARTPTLLSDNAVPQRTYARTLQLYHICGEETFRELRILLGDIWTGRPIPDLLDVRPVCLLAFFVRRPTPENLCPPVLAGSNASISAMCLAAKSTPAVLPPFLV